MRIEIEAGNPPRLHVFIDDIEVTPWPSTGLTEFIAGSDAFDELRFESGNNVGSFLKFFMADSISVRVE